MREFHKTMFEHEARLKYTDSSIEVFLENPCSLKAVKDIAEAFYIEFGTPSDRINLEPANGHVCLVVPVEDGKTESESENEENGEKQIDDEYKTKILNAALEALSEHENGLTPTELQHEIAKRGVIASTHWIGKVLKRVPYRLLEDLYKALPDEANSADVNAMATAVGIETSNLETYFMRILASEFGGELQKIGRSLILVKGDNR